MFYIKEPLTFSKDTEEQFIKYSFAFPEIKKLNSILEYKLKDFGFKLINC